MKRRDEKQESTSGIIGLGEYIVEWRKGQSREGIVAGAWTTDPVIVAFLLNPDDPATFRRFLLTSSIPIVSALFFFSSSFLSTCDKQRGCPRVFRFAIVS